MAEKNRRPREEVEQFVELLWREMPDDVEWLIGGSYRRKAPTIGDLDVMVVTESGLFGDFQFPKSFRPVRQGPQIVNGFLTISGDIIEAIGCDFWSCTPEQVSAFVMFITGPAALNIAQRAWAQKLGFTLSQYGLLNREGNLIDVRSERALYERLGLDWLEPEERQRWVEEPKSTAWEETPTERWRVPSSTDLNKNYIVSCKGGYWACHDESSKEECLGFRYSRSAPRECKHIRQVKKGEGRT